MFVEKEIVQKQKDLFGVLVGITNQDQSLRITKEYLEELSELSKTFDISIKKSFIQNIKKIDASTFIGSGKVNEIKEFVDANSINVVVFDDELTASQFRNLEKILKCEVLDRTQLILKIFEKNAKTEQAKLQVELAQSNYMYSRLVGLWSHHSRIKGGVGSKGAGEKEIETDRRQISNKISDLKQRLKKVEIKLNIQRKNRSGLVRISLVGYTNTGKTSLMNLLSKENFLAQDKLFATLDTVVRKIYIEPHTFLISDTVGFIRKLPHNLVESFKSTLQEVKEADLLLHVIDISNHNFESQIEEVEKVLKEIEADKIPVLYVFNKIDAFKFVPNLEVNLNDEDLNSEEVLVKLKKSWMSKLNKNCVFISVQNKENIDELKKLILTNINKIFPDGKK